VHTSIPLKSVWFTFVVVLGLFGGLAQEAKAGALDLIQTNRGYHILLSVDSRGVSRTSSPVSIQGLDFQKALEDQGGSGTFDEHTIEVYGYDGSGALLEYDTSRSGDEQYLLPWRLEKYYGVPEVNLNFVIPNETCCVCAVYFDTVESLYGQPDRYHGLVGDGDRFVEGYKRREINGAHTDTFCDLDGDGDLDLFEGGKEPYIYCYESLHAQTGEHRYVNKGKLTSDEQLLVLPHYSSNGRSALTVAFHDWDGDGDQDLFPSFADGPDKGYIVYYMNTTSENEGKLTFTRVDRFTTENGNRLGVSGGSYPAPTFIDWNNDELTDVIVGKNDRFCLHENLGPGGVCGFLLSECNEIYADGVPLDLENPRCDIVDIDNDGDLDFFAGCKPGTVSWYENVDQTPQKTNPTLEYRDSLIWENFTPTYWVRDGHSGVEVWDWTGDGLLDLVVGRWWERTHNDTPEQPRDYGWLLENVGNGSDGLPQWGKRDAYNGSPYTERFQIADAVCQNVVRGFDWNNDGKTDLLAGDTDGFIWYFENQTSNLYPVFATGEKILAGGEIIHFDGYDDHAHARHDISDWNSDGYMDLLAADGNGRVWLFLNTTNGGDPTPGFEPELAAGVRVAAGGVPIDRGTRAHMMVCDWDNDGQKDIVFTDQDANGYFWFENINTAAVPVPGELPVLSSAKRIYFNNQIPTYTRPNLGSYIDWDGDGIKDFIGFEFENSVRYYKNYNMDEYGEMPQGEVPQFADTDGVVFVKPYTIQQISGVHAIDWNQDGDIDILTGEGHDNSGFRYYEHDYIEDRLNDTHPAVVELTVVPGTPSEVSQLQAYWQSATAVHLSWVNPTETDFMGVMIRYRTDSYPTSITDGTLACEKFGSVGSADSFTHDVTASQDLYYTVFTYDLGDEYSSGANTLASYTDPPGEVNSFEAYWQGGEAVISLSWTNPNDLDFLGTMIRYRTNGFPTSPIDGTEVCNQIAAPGSSDSVLHTVTSGQTYYYTAFAHDGIPNYASGVNANPVTPWATGDFDHDRDVDQEDFGHLQACYGGDGILISIPECEDADLTGDLDADVQDFVIFQGCMKGPNQTPGC